MDFSHISFDSKNYIYDNPYWYPMDTEERFKDNLKKYPENKSLKYYLNNPIRYEQNKHRFRTLDEFDGKEKGNVYLGCSHTYGIGLHLKDTWAYRVNQVIGGKFWNLGIPGSGIDIQFAAFARYYKKLNIENVFLYLRHTHRYIAFDPLVNFWSSIAIHDKKQMYRDLFDRATFRNYLSEEYNYLHTIGFLNALQNLCRESKIKLHISTETTFNLKEYSQIPYEARDLMHMDIPNHIAVADMFIDLYDNYKEIDLNTLKL